MGCQLCFPKLKGPYTLIIFLLAACQERFAVAWKLLINK